MRLVPTVSSYRQFACPTHVTRTRVSFLEIHSSQMRQSLPNTMQMAPWPPGGGPSPKYLNVASKIHGPPKHKAGGSQHHCRCFLGQSTGNHVHAYGQVMGVKGIEKRQVRWPNPRSRIDHQLRSRTASERGTTRSSERLISPSPAKIQACSLSRLSRQRAAAAMHGQRRNLARLRVRIGDGNLSIVTTNLARLPVGAIGSAPPQTQPRHRPGEPAIPPRHRRPKSASA